MSRRWFAISQPGLSAAEKELWVPANRARFAGSEQSSADPLQPPRASDSSSGSSALRRVSVSTIPIAATTAAAVAMPTRRLRLRRSSAPALPASAPSSISSSSLAPQKTR